LVIFFFAGFLWALWTTRNKIYFAISLMQRWSMLLKEEDKEHVSQTLEAILGWMKNFKPRTTTVADVFEM
jgi:hypothetical protein